MARGLALLIAVGSASNVWAHPGHGTVDASTPMHYFLTPEHALPFLAVAAVSAVAFFWIRRARRQSFR
jgi:hypothetical protein